MASGVVKKDADPVWVRTGQDKDAVQLHFYETGLYYDCTFSARSVTNEDGESCAKKFKCHRFVLATVSEVFEKMLYGNFKEAYQGQDDEIKIEVSPTAFDLAMRFSYGNKCDFQSCELAVEIYYFAHKWMIESLLRAAGKFLIKKLVPEEALLVYKMCIDLNIDPETELRICCRKIIEKQSVEVLSSKHWLAAGRETILNFYLKISQFTVGEAYLLEKLVLWGKARCSSDQSTDLRAEIDPMLKPIRFRSMSCEELSAISKKCDVLTAEEKFKIMESLSLSDANLMPPEFSLKGYPRNLSISKKVDWSLLGWKIDAGTCENGSNRFSFYVDRAGIFLVGINLQSVDDALKKGTVISIACSVHRSDSGMKLGTAKLDEVRRDSWRGTGWIAFDEPVGLAKDFLYYIEIKYIRGQPIFPSYMNGDQKFQVCPGLCSIFFHSATKVRDVLGFILSNC